jgi:UDP-N-acetylglucosamine:LPS N-acetylglucosamine transferase
LLQELKNYPGTVELVRGLPKSTESITIADNVNVYNHAPATLLNKLICESEYVISRSGYTTVMDLLKLQKKSILVPTPGQAEQEYLAEYLHQKQFAYTVTQQQFSLQAALQAAREFPYHEYTASMEDYKSVIEKLLTSP